MPPTPTPTRADDELTAKEEAAYKMFASAVLLVSCFTLRRFIAPLSKGNYLLRELVFFLSFSTVLLIPINLFIFVVFVYHFQGQSIRRTIGFFCLWGAISYGLWNFI